MTETQTRKSGFQSSFRLWVKIVALVILLVFLPNQIAFARKYYGKYADLSSLFEEPSTSDLLASAGMQLAMMIGTNVIGSFTGPLFADTGVLGTTIAGTIGGGIGGYMAGGGKGALFGALGGGLGTLAGIELGPGLGLGGDLSTWAQIGGGLGGAIGGYAGSKSIAGAMGVGFGSAMASASAAKTAFTSPYSKIPGEFWPAYEPPGMSIEQSLGIARTNMQAAGLTFPEISTTYNFFDRLSQGWNAAKGDLTTNVTKYLTNFGSGALQSQVGQAAVLLSVRQLGMSPAAAQIVGYGVTGALTGGGFSAVGLTPPASNLYSGSTDFLGIGSWLNQNPVPAGFIMGALKGAMVGTGKVLADDLLKGTSLYDKNFSTTSQFGSLLGGAVGYLAYDSLMGGLGIDITTKTPFIVKPADSAKLPGDKLFDINPYFVNYAGDETGKYAGTPYALLNPDSFGGGFLGGLKLGAHDLLYNSNFASQVAGLGVEAALGSEFKFSRVLGQGFGNMAQAAIGGEGGFLKDMGNQLLKGALSGAASFALGSLGGEFDQKTGKNKLGLSELQMAYFNYLGTSLLNATYSQIVLGQDFHQTLEQGFDKLATDSITWGQTSPVWTQGAGGWNEVMYLNKIAEFGGFNDFKLNAERAMKMAGYKSWDKFVEDGKTSYLFPSFANSLVRYTASNLHYAAADNLSNIAQSAISLTAIGEALGLPKPQKPVAAEPIVLQGELTVQTKSYLPKIELQSDVEGRMQLPSQKPSLEDKQAPPTPSYFGINDEGWTFDIESTQVPAEQPVPAAPTTADSRKIEVPTVPIHPDWADPDGWPGETMQPAGDGLSRRDIIKETNIKFPITVIPGPAEATQVKEPFDPFDDKIYDSSFHPDKLNLAPAAMPTQPLAEAHKVEVVKQGTGPYDKQIKEMELELESTNKRLSDMNKGVGWENPVVAENLRLYRDNLQMQLGELRLDQKVFKEDNYAIERLNQLPLDTPSTVGLKVGSDAISDRERRIKEIEDAIDNNEVSYVRGLELEREHERLKLTLNVPPQAEQANLVSSNVDSHDKYLGETLQQNELARQAAINAEGYDQALGESMRQNELARQQELARQVAKNVDDHDAYIGKTLRQAEQANIVSSNVDSHDKYLGETLRQNELARQAAINAEGYDQALGESMRQNELARQAAINAEGYDQALGESMRQNELARQQELARQAAENIDDHDAHIGKTLRQAEQARVVAKHVDSHDKYLGETLQQNELARQVAINAEGYDQALGKSMLEAEAMLQYHKAEMRDIRDRKEQIMEALINESQFYAEPQKVEELTNELRRLEWSERALALARQEYMEGYKISQQSPLEQNRDWEEYFRLKSLQARGDVWLDSPGFDVIAKAKPADMRFFGRLKEIGSLLATKFEELGGTFVEESRALWGGKNKDYKKENIIYAFNKLDIEIKNVVEKIAEEYKVDANDLYAIMYNESRFNQYAVSRKEAKGFMQLSPGTAQELGITDIFDPKQNIEGGLKYLLSLMKYFDGDAFKALLAYNGGLGRVENWAKEGKIQDYKIVGVRGYQETKEYVQRLFAAREAFNEVHNLAGQTPTQTGGQPVYIPSATTSLKTMPLTNWQDGSPKKRTK